MESEGLSMQHSQRLEEAGFVVPEPLRGGTGSSLDRSRHYDQIALYPRGRTFDATGRAGVFDFSSIVFCDDDEPVYASIMGAPYAAKETPAKRTAYYRQWRTFQMSDHLVLWAELDVGRAGEYLGALRDPR